MKRLFVWLFALTLAWGCTEESNVTTVAPPPGSQPSVVANSDSVWVIGKSIFVALSVDKEASNLIMVTLAPVRDSFPMLAYWKDLGFDYWQNADRHNPTQVELRYRNGSTKTDDTLTVTVAR